MRTATCSECRREFSTRVARKATCSARCARLRAKRSRSVRTPGRRDEQGRWLVACAECGAEFPAERGRKACSPECDTARRRRRWRAYWHSLTPAEKQEYREKHKARLATDPEKAQAMWRQQGRRERERNPIPATTCDVCGREFQGKRKDSRFCSPECRAASAPGVAGKTRHDCIICGKSFIGRKNQIYCGPQCQRESLAQRQRKDRREVAIADDIALIGLAISLERAAGKYLHICRECGREFRSDSAQAARCSAECRRARLASMKRAAHRRIVFTPVPCDICGSEFTPGKSSDKRCSEWCRAEHKRRAMQAAMQTPQARERQKQLARKRHGVSAACKICGRDMSDFTDLRVNRYTCSPECRREALRRKQRRVYEKRTGKTPCDD